MLSRCHQTQQSSLGAIFPKLISHRLPPSPTPTDWHIIVSDYSSRNLTHETDKIPTLSGLAEVYRHSTNHTYIFGLWRETLLKSLLWKERFLIYGNRVVPGVPAMYRAPSWSWASLDGNVTFLTSTDYDALEMKTEVVGTFIDLVPDLDLSVGKRLKGDWICIRGPVLQGEIKNGEMSLRGGGWVVSFMDIREIEEEGEGRGPRHMSD